MDDVDAVQAQIARTMLESGDWVTARLDGVAYLEKSPLIYWMMAGSFRVFGVHDWAARIPLALSVVLLCWVTYRFGRWAMGEQAGVFSGVALATSVGLYLFTRIQIPDAVLTLTIAVTLWAWMRLQEPEEANPRAWAILMGFALGCGLLLKGLIAIVFPLGAGLLYMAATRQLWSGATWKRLQPWLVLLVMMVVAAPWHVLATLWNPPYFAFSMHSGPGEYHGFFWFYFFNEHLLRFLNLRYPRDYNTVPRALFWVLNLAWLFPWSAFLPGAVKLSYNRGSRAGRLRLMLLCWIGVVMVFFTFSTTQEYYSMPIYPALALLAGAAIAEGRWVRAGRWFTVAIFGSLAIVLGTVLFMAARLPAKGELADALAQHPEMYTLSLGHMLDLTLGAFAYLKLPLALAVAAFAIVAVGAAIARRRVGLMVAVMVAGMVVFFQAARLALVRFDPYMGSYQLATALLESPPGTLIEADAYYAFSSVFFYTNREALLLNGRSANLEYGSYAPNAPQVFIDDAGFVRRWESGERYYLLTDNGDLPHLRELVGEAHLHVVKQSSGKSLLSNM
ncbi:phospholipid carrier-dependent glycosyltransferase [Terriglobus albidus]|uniref:Phospholipid carrier-dependent glycosyltransferase n=2 Tax=Terriglobus albidus TaxID=1592106 RepID=A0A5B9EGX7_9BACT|nr:phospholipid carrier-dependent glycosyltransferase [Terriglobus albidus]